MSVAFLTTSWVRNVAFCITKSWQWCCSRKDSVDLPDRPRCKQNHVGEAKWQLSQDELAASWETAPAKGQQPWTISRSYLLLNKTLLNETVSNVLIIKSQARPAKDWQYHISKKTEDPQDQPNTQNQPCWTLSLAFELPDMWENKHDLFMSPSCGICDGSLGWLI